MVCCSSVIKLDGIVQRYLKAHGFETGQTGLYSNVFCSSISKPRL
jgi:hypothetical protein